MFYIYQIIVWFIFLLFLGSKINNKNWKIIFSIIAAIFYTLEIVALYLTGKFIDYQFYTHLNINAIEGHGFQFIAEASLLVVLFIVVTFVFYFGLKKLHYSALNRNRFSLPIIFTSVILMSLPNAVLNEAYGVYQILNAEEKNFKQALTDLGIPPEEYILPYQLTAQKGKNIIVISVESLEQGFLSESFDNIAPNLTTLSKNWTYYDQMPRSPGSGWTAGSLYSHQVGMPAFFKGQGNDFFQGVHDVKLTGLGHILKRAGYNSKYIIGNKEFAGISDILTTYEIDVISEKNSLGKEYPKIGWGLNDFDIFQEAKLQVKALTENTEKPFALFISTLNTHFPNGVYDKRMAAFVPSRENNLEFSVSAVDYLINNFIDYLKQENILDNTAIFIFPDHLLMGNTGPTVKKLKESERRLYLITNASEDKLPKKTDNRLYQIDLPQIILHGAEIKTNAKFLTDFIENDDVINYLNTNKIKLTTLNTASVTKKDYQNGIDIKVSRNKLLISSDDSQIALRLSKKAESEIFDITFNPEMVLIEYQKSNSENVLLLSPYDKKYNRLHLIVYIKDKEIDQAYLGNKQAISSFKKGKRIKYTKEDILLLMEPNTVKLYGKNSNRFIAHAGGGIDGYKYTNSLEALNFNYKNGFRLFELDIIKTSDNIYVAAHDWTYWAEKTGYQGDLPPSRKEFLNQKFYNKYSAMDMDAINVWFAAHPDAILVTDKVNTPIDFANNFVDKNRLMMELFTWDAVKKGFNAKIKSPMPTAGILNEIKENKISFLHDLGITDIAASRRILDTQKELVSDIVKSGINIFAFHLHFDKGKDETYVVCNEREYFYGMYADQWNFNTEPDCSKY